MTTALLTARENLAKVKLAASKLHPAYAAVVEAKTAMLMRAESLSTIETLAYALASAEMLVRHLERKEKQNG